MHKAINTGEITWELKKKKMPPGTSSPASKRVLPSHVVTHVYMHLQWMDSEYLI